jgi:hypothetical protein
MSLAQTPDLKRSIRISSLAAALCLSACTLDHGPKHELQAPQTRRVADLNASELVQDVVLIRALGGGFHS